MGRSKTPLSVDENTKLIELVRQHRALYDPMCHQHKDAHIIYNLWNDIALQMGRDNMDGVEWKKKWRNLRDTFVKKKRAQRVNNPSAKSWRFLDHMSFLDPYIEDNMFHSENSVNSVVSDEAYSDCVSIKEEDVSECTARTDMAMISPDTPEMDPATRVINNVANHRKRPRQEHRDPYELTWRDHKNYLGEATVPEPDVPSRSAAQVFFESCALRMEKLSPRHQSFLQLQVSQLLFNAENPDVTPLAIIPLPRHQPSEKFHKDTAMIERDQRD